MWLEHHFRGQKVKGQLAVIYCGGLPHSLLCPRPHRAEALSDDACLTSVCLSVFAFIRPKSRTKRPRKTKIGIEITHVTRDSDTTFKVKRSKVNLQGAGAYCGGLPHSLLFLPTQCEVSGDAIAQPMRFTFVCEFIRDKSTPFELGPPILAQSLILTKSAVAVFWGPKDQRSRIYSQMCQNRWLLAKVGKTVL